MIAFLEDSRLKYLHKLQPYERLISSKKKNVCNLTKMSILRTKNAKNAKNATFSYVFSLGARAKDARARPPRAYRSRFFFLFK